MQPIRITLFFLAGILFPILLFGHEGHMHPSPPKTEKVQAQIIEVQEPEAKESVATMQNTGYRNFIKWIGNFHPIAIHFPIALIIMSAFAEVLFMIYPYPIFTHSSRFMIIAAAFTAVPAALLGLAYGYDANYSGALVDIFWWHRFMGISTAVLAIITALINELNIRKTITSSLLYRIALFTSAIFVTITGFLGGKMTFG